MDGRPFPGGPADQVDLTAGQVAETPVDELRGARRRARAEVVALDQRHPEAPAGRVAGHPCAGDPAPHDDDVETVGLELVEQRGP